MKKRYTGAKAIAATFAVGFLVLILLGTLLLMLPIATVSRTPTSFVNALFTSASATCVTGLIVVDTATYWSLFGQLVILTLIQIGGLGFMSLAVMLATLVGRAISPKEKILALQSYSIGNYMEPIKLLKRIVFRSFAIEAIGAGLLAIRFIPLYGFGNGIYKSIFHSISAFCNAGFDIAGKGNALVTSFGYFADDPLVSITICVLIITGGLGFIVTDDLINFVMKKKRISVYSRLVLIITGILLVTGTVGYFLLERNNPDTLGGHSFGYSLLNSFFQSVTLRTAGFAMIDNSLTSAGSRLLAIFMMFIGGASGSTAGGVKVVTIGVLVITVLKVAAGRRNVTVLGRRIPENLFLQAATVVFIQFFLAAVGTLTVASVMRVDGITAMFEVVSAGGTVGLSLGLTPYLNTFCKLLITLYMYFGRVGILGITYTLTLSLGHEKDAVTCPDANFIIG